MPQSLPRIALVVHGFPPRERTGVENHVASLAAALARRGAEVEVFAACADRSRTELDTWREERDGHAITYLAAHRSPRDARAALDRPGAARVFGAWLDERKIGLVHFHHVIKLGVSLIEEASKRALPIAYTAHDYYALSPRYTLLAPDLGEIEPGDLEAEVRCDLALEILDRIPRLGDHHGAVLDEQLEPDERAALRAVLHGDPRDAGFTSEKIRAAGALRRDLEIRRRAAFRRVDRFLAPTRFVAETFVRAGFPRASIELDEYGLDLAPFRSSSASAELESRDGARNTERSHDARRVSFGYFGALVKHKGVHVLLDAYSDLAVLPGRASLDVHGASRDGAYVDRLARQAERAGARLHGGYDAADVARLLANVDAIVVPSIWRENAPFVIREAYAARVPVIATRAGALSESVRDGVDGLLCDARDTASLRAAMRACTDDPDLLPRLCAGIRPVRSIDGQAADLIERYRALAEAKRGSPVVAMPAHVVPFAERVRALERLSGEELGARVLRGLGELRLALLGADARAEDLLAETWSARGHLADTLSAWERERAWLADVAADKDQAVRALEAHATELARSLDATTGGRADHERARAELEKRSRWLEESLADKTREAAWIRSTLDAKAKEVEWLRESLAVKSREAEELARAIAEKAAVAERSRAEVDAERERARWLASVAEGERAHRTEAERRRAGAETGRETIERERDWLASIAADREREITWRKAEMERAEASRAELERDLARERARITELEAELEWRRSEMRVVQTAIREKLFPLVSRDLRWRAKHWPQDEPIRGSTPGDGSEAQPEAGAPSPNDSTSSRDEIDRAPARGGRS